jgi:hypothetical protein
MLKCHFLFINNVKKPLDCKSSKHGHVTVWGLKNARIAVMRNLRLQS